MQKMYQPCQLPETGAPQVIPVRQSSYGLITHSLVVAFPWIFRWQNPQEFLYRNIEWLVGNEEENRMTGGEAGEVVLSY